MKKLNQEVIEVIKKDAKKVGIALLITFSFILMLVLVNIIF